MSDRPESVVAPGGSDGPGPDSAPDGKRPESEPPKKARRGRPPGKGPKLKPGAGKARKIYYENTSGISLRVFLEAALDERSVVFQMVAERARAFSSQLGNDLTPAQDRIVQQAARLGVLSDSTWAAVQIKGLLNEEGAQTQAVDSFMKVARAEREALNAIGLERRQKPLPSLGEYLATKNVPDAGDDTE